jgi:hypothetical protein
MADLRWLGLFPDQMPPPFRGPPMPPLTGRPPKSADHDHFGLWLVVVMVFLMGLSNSLHVDELRRKLAKLPACECVQAERVETAAVQPPSTP